MVDQNTTVIGILGMHRSGTSCLTGTLEECGVYLGEVVNSAPHNIKGNKEHLALREINEDILRFNNATWDDPPETISWDRQHIEGRSKFIQGFNGRSVWGFKDPRTLLTLPFWLEALPGLHLIATFRHPIAVAKSLARRDQITIEKGLTIWNHYNLKLLEYVTKESIELVCFDWERDRYLDRIQRFNSRLGVFDSPASESLSFYDAQLRHNLVSGCADDCDHSCMKTYQRLCELVAEPNCEPLN